MNRKHKLLELFRDIDESKLILVSELIDDIAFLEIQMRELKNLPFIRVHPKYKSKQELTKAAKLYKDCSQSYDNKIKILVSLLNKENATLEDDPVSEFMKLYEKGK